MGRVVTLTDCQNLATTSAVGNPLTEQSNSIEILIEDLESSGSSKKKITALTKKKNFIVPNSSNQAPP